MKKIMVLTSKYLPNPSANGINTKYIINELNKRGYDITCISLRSDDELDFEIIDDTKIYRVTPSSYTKVLESELQNNKSGKAVYYSIRHILRKVKLALLLPVFPNYDPKQSQKVFKRLEELHKLNTFDCVVGVFKPYSNIAALKKFKQKYSDVVCIGYYLDLINSMQRPKIMPKFVYDWLINRENSKSTRLFDANLIAIAGKYLFNNIKDEKILEKVNFIDFPTFVTNRHVTRLNTTKIERNEILIIYAGTLNTKYRNPEILLSILSEASKHVGHIKLNIYGNNDCGELFKKYNHKHMFEVNNNGFCPHEVVIEAIQNSDFLINVSNKIQDAVPSKIFELFSTGKPIINLVFDKNDITTSYFSKYPCVININSWDDLKAQIGDIKYFISKNTGKIFELEVIKKKYIENTPEYTVDIIDKVLP